MLSRNLSLAIQGQHSPQTSGRVVKLVMLELDPCHFGLLRPRSVVVGGECGGDEGRNPYDSVMTLQWTVVVVVVVGAVDVAVVVC